MSSPNPPDAALPRVTVIIATRNRPEDLVRCLATVLANDYACFDVLVIDQGDGPLPPLPASRRLRYYRQATQGKARALNAAMKVTDAPILLFTDDDCTVDTSWIRTAVTILGQHPGVGVMYGALEGIPHHRREVHIPEFEPWKQRVRSGPRTRIVRTRGVGANMAARADALALAGGFDEAFSPGGPYGTGEDTELAYRLLRLGGSVLETPAWRATHWGQRRFDLGDVRELIVRSYRAFGAMYGRNLRRGDPLAAAGFAVQLSEEVRSIVDDTMHLRRPLGVRRILGLVAGAVQGFREAKRLPRRGAAVPLLPVEVEVPATPV